MANTSKYETWFEHTFGAPCPLVPRLPLSRTVDANFWASTSDAPHALSPSTLMIPAFPSPPNDWVVSGVWGHGTSNAFYYVDCGTRHRYFFRLSFGSVYGDQEEETREVVRFLRAFAAWRARWEAHFDEVEITLSMTTVRAKLTSTRSDALAQWTDEDVPRGAPAGDADPPPHTFWDRLEQVLLGARPR